MPIVYQHIRKDNNNVFYIGIGKSIKRAKERYGRNVHWKSIVNKHGYTVSITHENICWDEAKSIEKYLISFYGRKDLGLGVLSNKTDGGDGVLNIVRSEASIAKWRLKTKGVKKPLRSEEVRKAIGEKLSIILKGKKLKNPRSEEYRLKMSLAKKGKKTKPLTEEHKKRLSEIHKGKKVSDATKEKMRISNRRSHTEESKIKISEMQKKSYIKRKENGTWFRKKQVKLLMQYPVLNLENGIFENNAKEAAFVYGYNHSTLKSMLNGNNKNKTNLIYAKQ